MSAFVPAALKRVAREADGWNPVVLSVAAMEETFGSIKQMAKDSGRDSPSLSLIVRANIELSDKPQGKDRTIFTGSMEQISEDLCGWRRSGPAKSSLIQGAAEGQFLDYWMSLLDQLIGTMRVS